MKSLDRYLTCYLNRVNESYSSKDKKEIDDKLSDLFKQYVPADGKAKTVGGEAVRAINRIMYRYFNDGDQVGRGYGCETCNAPARYLYDLMVEMRFEDYNDCYIFTLPGRALWGHAKSQGKYIDDLYFLAEKVLKMLEQNPEMFQRANHKDMWDCSDDTYDRNPDWDDDDDDWDENEEY